MSDPFGREYEAVIGLEVHAQLQTASKLFSGAAARFGAAPNSQVNAVDLGLPGVLPVVNRRCVELAMRAGMALHCEVRRRSRFARKHYFYPDLPRGYQISQHAHPICVGGHLDVKPGSGGGVRVRIRRLHLEEDAGKSSHARGSAASLVDFNRAGVPLIEIVTEPDLQTSEQAIAYLKELRDILMYVGVCDGNMEQGSFRCDANVSVRARGARRLGTRTELKNMNSFRTIREGIDCEIARQVEMRSRGERVIQQTRSYDPEVGRTIATRSKERAVDYRYFAEPDLPPVEIDEAWLERVRASLPELPAARRERYARAFGVDEDDAAVLTASRDLADYFEAAVAACSDSPQRVANWIVNEMLAVVDVGTEMSQVRVSPAQLGALIERIGDGKISGKIAKRVFEIMLETGDHPDAVIEAQGLEQVSEESALCVMIEAVMEANPAQVQAYREGNRRVFGWFMGQIMQRSQGRANPERASALLRRELEEEV